MNTIYWLYIIDETGTIIDRFENQEEDGSSSAELSHLLSALLSTAKTLKHNEIRSILTPYSNNRFFLCKDKMFNNLFVMKTNRDADTQVLSPILKDIMIKFVQTITTYITPDFEGPFKRFNSFRKYVKNIIKEISDNFNG